MDPRIPTLTAALCLAAALTPGARAQTPEPTPTEETIAMTKHARGTFDVELPREDAPEGWPEGFEQRALEKTFAGDLEGVSRGKMLSVTTDVQGSAGYVAMEVVTGTLDGRRGTFALQHSGTMTRGEPSLSVTVVPDSATGELVGLVGTMQILIEDGRHEYELDYTLPDSP